jgi:hypothetical protein
VEERLLTPPFRPDVDGDMCVANFDEDFTSLPAEDNSPCTSPTPELTAQAKDHFSGYALAARRCQGQGGVVMAAGQPRTESPSCAELLLSRQRLPPTLPSSLVATVSTSVASACTLAARRTSPVRVSSIVS